MNSLLLTAYASRSIVVLEATTTELQTNQERGDWFRLIHPLPAYQLTLNLPTYDHPARRNDPRIL